MLIKLDPHIHSSYSKDSTIEIKDILKKSKEIGLDAIAISDHNTIEGSKKAIKYSNEDLLVLPSIEISSNKGHILGLGVEENIKKNLSPEETIDYIHDANGLAIIPHPYCFYRHGLLDKINYKIKFDGLETLNARFILGYSNNKAKKLSKKENIPGLGSSDAHHLNFIGDCYSEIDCEKDIDSILKSIKKGKVKAKGKGTSNIKLSSYLFKKHCLKKY